MAQEIQYTSDATGSIQKTMGSDGRLNVSSRADSRSYYNSRDEQQAYSISYNMDVAAAGEYIVYLQNNSTTGKILVVDAIGINSDSEARFKLWYVTGTASGGNTLTPTNLNKSSSNAATATVREGGTEATGIAGLTTSGLVDFLFCNGHEEFRLGDRLRLGQNDAIAIEMDEGTAVDSFGVIFGFFE